MTGPWLKGMPRSLDYPTVGYDAVLAGVARAYPDRIALLDGELTLTFAELWDHVLRLARGLREHGVRQGDLVALHMPNTLWFPVAYFAVLCAGATACPVNPAQPPAALRRQFEDFGAIAVITHPACAAALDGGRTRALRLVLVSPATEAAPAAEPACLPQDAVALEALLASEPLDGRPIDPEAVAHLQLTGGTTGRSKGVRVLHRNLVVNVIQSSAWRCGARPVCDEHGGVRLEAVPEAQHPHSLPLGRSTFLTVSPFFHGMGLVGHCANTLMGSTVVVQGRFDPVRYLADIERYRATNLLGSPAFYHGLLRTPGIDERDLSSVRSLFSGSAPIDTTTLRRLAKVFPQAEVVEGYGLSEATAMVTMQPSRASADSPIGSVGVPVFDTELELRADNGSTVIEPGRSGEIWVRGPQITDGYHRDPELTAQQYRDGWLRTGDLGRFDEQGSLFIVGRAKDMVIYKGYNVYPAHLEEVLGAHPEVAQSSVVGAPRHEVGEIPVAFVVLRSPGHGGPELAERLMAYVSEHVAPYQRVREVVFVAEMPLTPTGKVLKSALREMLRDRPPTPNP